MGCWAKNTLVRLNVHAKGYPNRQVLSNQQAILDNQRDIQRRMETLEEYLPFGRSPAPTQYSHSSPCSTPPSPAPSFPSSPTQLPSPIVTARPMIAVSSEQLQLWKDSTGTITKLASFMVRRWYSKEEMSSSNCNGSRGKSQLDQTRLHQIRDLCFQAYGVRHRMMEEKWKVLVTAIDATCRSINRKPRRQARQ